MFDFSKLSDMTKIANQAKQMQAQQQEYQSKQAVLLEQISGKLDKIISLLEKTHG